MSIELDLLGTFRVRVHGEELTKLPDQPMRAALLAYLAVEREVPRDRAITDFQKRNEAPEKTRHRLNQTLHVLRSDIESRGQGSDWVSSRGPVIGVSQDVVTDLARFEEAASDGDFEGALELYGGDFLDGRDALQSTPNFEPWVSRVRDRLRRRHHEISTHVIERRVAIGDVPGAIEVARQWVQLDPLDDYGQDQLIRLLVRAGSRTEALQQYFDYEETVWRAFGDVPWESTRTLVESLDVRPSSAEELRRRDAAEFEARGPKARSVVVAWFASNGGADDLEARTGGLVRRLRDALAAEALEVEPITATLYVKEHPAEPEATARALNVAWVVDGVVTGTDAGLELEIRVVRARDARTWTAVFRVGSDEEEFHVHREVALWAASAIMDTIDGERGKLEAERRSRLTRAMSLFDVALVGFEDRSAEGFTLAVEKLQEALEVEPNFARAHAKLASVYIAQAQFGFCRPADVMAKALAASDRALEIEPDEPEAFAARGHYHDTYMWDWASAESDYLRSIELSPEGFDARTWYADMLTAMGRFRDARAQIRDAEAAHPLSGAVRFSKGAQHYRAGRYSQAIESLEQALALKPYYLIALIIRSFARLALGDAEIAAREMEGVRAMIPMPHPLVEVSLGVALARLGREEEARGCLGIIQAIGQKVWVPALVRMILHAHLGDLDSAGEELELAGEERWGQLIYIAVDPIYEPLRAHPRYPEMAKRLGLEGVVPATGSTT